MKYNATLVWQGCRFGILAVAAAGAIFAARPAAASLQVLISPSTVPVVQGSTDSFDVTLTNSGPSAVDIGGFAFQLSVSSSYLTFTKATTATTAPYVFAGTSGLGPIISVGSPSQTLTADDITTLVSGVTLGSGSTVGLGHVLFNVSSSAPLAAIPVTFSAYPFTSVSEPSGRDIPIDFIGSAMIDVVPEPAMLTIFSIGIGLVAVVQVSRKIRRRAG